VTLPYRLIVRARLCSTSGWGRVAYNLARGLADCGWPIAFDPTVGKDERQAPMEPWAAERIVAPADDVHGLAICPPFMDLACAKQTIVYTMWESSGLRPLWVQKLNACAGVVVPSTWQAACFTAAGVKPELIDVVPPGIDCETFTPGRKDSTTFTVGMAGRMYLGGVRKGLVEGVAAFRKAFPDDPDVRLDVRCGPDDPVPDFGDSRIRIDRGRLSDAGLAAWYAGLGLFLSPSRGEGWGLHLHEAMACGTPCASVLWGGCTEFLDPSNCYPLPYRLEAARETYEGMGAWAVPTPDGMVAALRLARSDADLRAFRSRCAAGRARTLTNQRAAERLSEVLTRRLRPVWS
jgi:glycosyltransferase involved in cell wall biosynthesis